jgi:hypothetical protein
VARLRDAFERHEPGLLAWEPTWGETFAVIRERRELYQDCFILLSSGPYSGVAAADLGLSSDEWNRLSITIRLEHECAHYFTRRLCGAMGASLLDELIADYAGITAAIERFRAEWFLRFLGLEDARGYRPGGRLESYRGTPPLSDGAFVVLQRVVRCVAATLEAVDALVRVRRQSAVSWARMTLTLASTTLEELAAAGAVDRVCARYRATVTRRADRPTHGMASHVPS